MEYINKLPLSVSLVNKKALVKQVFGISDQTFYYLNRKINDSATDFYHLSKLLD